MTRRIFLLIWVVVFTFIQTLCIDSYAVKKNKKAKAPAYTPTQTSLVIDAKTGKILHTHNSKELIYPASLTKVMTLYIAYEKLKSGKLKLDQKVKVSKHATTPIPLKLYLKAGQMVTIRDLILGIIVHSANDASIVLAEAIAGSEKEFAKLMTTRARQLGMKNTTFKNASGLFHPEQQSTAIDLAKMALAINRDFPEYKQYFSKTSFQFNGKEIRGHNAITAKYPGADGMKTGYLSKSGCNIISTATRGKKSLVVVVTGAKSAVARNNQVKKILDHHFGVQHAEKPQKHTKKPTSPKMKKISAKR